ncbi:MAG: helix-hairpin-helix domain-containing protein [Ardenticatenaceae bacterium]|nr:helix-hairpin-helix domain-containing protein [Anaerolineales bacterium]MCB8920058.1 helix-hairpin-helix domain-containing protein [Ardenticatenaceae bacterium]MCB8989903.1 helix-hairpin-helix domain-containing protein [Ardenticatenaceae bacterium]
MKRNSQLAGILVGLLLGVVLGAGGVTLAKRQMPAPIEIVPPLPTAMPQATATPGPLHVYVNGQVMVSGVYELPPGSLVQDALTAAGGLEAAAAADFVNLAQPLQDGMQVYVPEVGEETAVLQTLIISPTAIPAAAPDTEAGSTAGGLLNLNTASVAELDTLPGIGPSTAQKILDYREENGLFTTVDDIMNVSGIGPAKFEAIKELITVGNP